VKTIFAAGAILAGLLLVGCPAENYPNQVPATLTDINRIVNSTTLDPQEQRSELEALGVTDSTINAFLSSIRLANQYGGNLRSAYNKVVNGQFTSLTPDEVQIYGDQASLVDPNHALQVNLSDDEAQAVVNFFQDNNIPSKDALSAWLSEAGNTPPTTIPSGVLKALFVDFDPKLLLPKLP
jgi:hypothetical protein